MTALESDWPLLVQLRKPLSQGPTPPPEDFLEDWDVLQGRASWFVALLDDQGERIPGSTHRFGLAPSMGHVRCPKVALVTGFIWWREGWNNPQKASLHPRTCEAGAWVQVDLWSGVNITTSSVNYVNVTWSFPSDPIVTTTSTAANFEVRYVTVT